MALAERKHHRNWHWSGLTLGKTLKLKHERNKTEHKHTSMTIACWWRKKLSLLTRVCYNKQTSIFVVILLRPFFVLFISSLDRLKSENTKSAVYNECRKKSAYNFFTPTTRSDILVRSSCICFSIFCSLHTLFPRKFIFKFNLVPDICTSRLSDRAWNWILFSYPTKPVKEALLANKQSGR